MSNNKSQKKTSQQKLDELEKQKAQLIEEEAKLTQESLGKKDCQIIR
jgi:hypothetical protein